MPPRPCAPLVSQAPELIDIFPEMGFVRDTIFLFKTLMVPTSETLPPVSPWQPVDAKLQWKFNVKEKVFMVWGFGQQLQATSFAKEEKAGLFGKLKHVFGMERAGGRPGPLDGEGDGGPPTCAERLSLLVVYV